MQVKVIREGTKDIEIEVTGIDQSLLQIVQEELLNDGRVEFAAYNRPHPLLKEQRMQVTVRDGNPREIFNEACRSAVKRASETTSLLNDALGGA
jgi:DNA-directed RNA polymerase subunit L